jgi:hypothetical protein
VEQIRKEYAMLQVKRYLLVFSVLLFAACNAVTQLFQATQIPVPTPTAPEVTDTPLPPTATVAPTATATETMTPSPSETATPAAAIPLFLTSTPGIAATLTAVFSTPGAQETLAAQQTMEAATVGAKMQGFSTTLLSQCPNPSDPPKQKWVDIPVMPQATAGQEVQTLIGSYYCFRAPVTVADMETFYKNQLTSPNWIMQSDENGQMVFVGVSMTGAQFLTLDSGPGNKNDLIVAINVTNPMMMPTWKP